MKLNLKIKALFYSIQAYIILYELGNWVVLRFRVKMCSTAWDEQKFLDWSQSFAAIKDNPIAEKASRYFALDARLHRTIASTIQDVGSSASMQTFVVVIACIASTWLFWRRDKVQTDAPGPMVL